MSPFHFADPIRDIEAAYVICGEQAILFFRDHSGTALEFKEFVDLGQIFAS